MFKLQNISKAYGNYHALKNVNLTIHPGEIHGLAGVNGSGKTTLLNILSGQPIIHQTGGFSGEILFKGKPPQDYSVKANPLSIKEQPFDFEKNFVFEEKPLTFKSPKEAMSFGIGMVHQEFALLSTLTVAENITLTREKIIPFTQKLFGKNLARIDEKANTQTASLILESIGIRISEEMLTGTLSVSTRQFVEIAREIGRQDLTLLLLDEPTAVLNKAEAERFMGAVRKMADRGISILYVSHKIEELISLCDRITVLRGGEVAGSVNVELANKNSFLNSNKDKDTLIKNIVRLMTGSRVIKTRRESFKEDFFEFSQTKCSQIECSQRPLAIATSGFTVDKHGDILKGLDLIIYKGEILGITGLSGHGRNALGPGIMGLYPTSGKLTLYDDQDINISSPDYPRDAHQKEVNKMVRKNIWLVPEDRRNLGLLMEHSIIDNITFAAIQKKKMFIKKSIFPFITFPDTTACYDHANKCVKDLDIKCSSVFQKVQELSGGNQQKVCIAAALTMQPDTLFVSEPTRGIDIAGKESILNLLVKAHKNHGMTIVISSGELDELKRICDRIAVVYEGRLFDIFTSDTSDEEFALAFSGLR